MRKVHVERCATGAGSLPISQYKNPPMAAGHIVGKCISALVKWVWAGSERTTHRYRSLSVSSDFRTTDPLL